MRLQTRGSHRVVRPGAADWGRFALCVFAAATTTFGAVAYVSMQIWVAAALFGVFAVVFLVLVGLLWVSLRAVVATFDDTRRVLQIDGVELAYDHIGEVHLRADEHGDDDDRHVLYTLVVRRKDAVERAKALGAAVRPDVDAWRASSGGTGPMPDALHERMMQAVRALLGGTYTLGMSRSRAGSRQVTAEVGQLLGVSPTYEDDGA